MRTIHTKAFGLPVYAHGWPHSGLTVMSWPQYSEFSSRHWEENLSSETHSHQGHTMLNPAVSVTHTHTGLFITEMVPGPTTLAEAMGKNGEMT